MKTTFESLIETEIPKTKKAFTKFVNTSMHQAPKIKIPKLEKLDCSRGAPMGRPNIYPTDRNTHIKLSLQKVKVDGGGYDKGGAYWGHTTLTLYRAVSPEVIPCQDYRGYHNFEFLFPEIFLWAACRKEAIMKIKEELPNAKVKA